MPEKSTVAAISTGPGGALAVIRISGPDALAVANSVWKGRTPLGHDTIRILRTGKCMIGCDGLTERAMAVFMAAPASYTGEDVVEIHCHGGSAVPAAVLKAAVAAGAVHAPPGEFTRRAFMNGKMDLTQAEAVADIIAAHSEMALKIAERQLEGRLGKRIRQIHGEIVSILSETEARLDFSEEDISFPPAGEAVGRLGRTACEVRSLLDSAAQGRVLREGVRVVIAGRPNSGKSSLLNLLLGYDRAIVTEFPGTTRDTLEEFTTIRNIPMKLIDTAGIREAESLIEKSGIERTKKSIGQAQIVLWLLDAAADPAQEVAFMHEHLKERGSVVAAWNKTDLLEQGATLPDTAFPAARISALKNTGVETLLDAVEKEAWGTAHAAEPDVAVSSRHAALLEEAIKAITQALEHLGSEDWELAAVHLRAAAAPLAEITGENASPDVLDEIFKRFCIGK